MINEKALTIDPKLITYIKTHPQFEKLFQNSDLIAPKLTVPLEYDDYPIQPHFITTLYLYTMKAMHYNVPIF